MAGCEHIPHMHASKVYLSSSPSLPAHEQAGTYPPHGSWGNMDRVPFCSFAHRVVYDFLQAQCYHPLSAQSFSKYTMGELEHSTH